MKMKKMFLAFICLCVSIVVNAQCYKVVSVERQTCPTIKLLQVLETEDRVLVYGTITTTSEINYSRIGRKTTIVKNGMRYKILNSVNLPLYDEAEPRKLYLKKGESANFVIEFEKFDTSGSFDFVEKEGEDSPNNYNFYGIKVEKIDQKEMIDTKRFLDSPHTIWGNYVENGTPYYYFIRDDVMIEYKNSWFDDDFLLELRVVNNSDHGVMIDMDKIQTTAIDKKGRTVGVVRYTADSYDALVEQNRREAAYYNTGGNDTSRQNSRLKDESKKTDNIWAQIGLDALQDLNNQAQENRIQKYLKDHPRKLAKALRTTSLRPGESVSGYIPYKKIRKMKSINFKMILDDYTYNYGYTI